MFYGSLTVLANLGWSYYKASYLTEWLKAIGPKNYSNIKACEVAALSRVSHRLREWRRIAKAIGKWFARNDMPSVSLQRKGPIHADGTWCDWPAGDMMYFYRYRLDGLDAQAVA